MGNRSVQSESKIAQFGFDIFIIDYICKPKIKTLHSQMPNNNQKEQSMILVPLSQGVFVTVPLYFAAVQPWVWPWYAAGMASAFLFFLWQQPFAKRQNSFLLNACWVGFLTWTLMQCLPMPLDILAALSPYRERILSDTAALAGLELKWSAISYDSRTSMAWWVFLLTLFLFYRVLKHSLSDARRLKQVLRVVMLLAALEALYGIVQALVPWVGVLGSDASAFDNARGTFINRNHFAGFLEMVFPLCLGYTCTFIRWGRQPEKVKLKQMFSSDYPAPPLALGVVLAILLVALIFSRSKAGIVAAGIGFFVFALLVRLGHGRFSTGLGIGMAASFGLTLIYSFRIGLDSVFQRFLRIGAATDRFQVWQDAWPMAVDHPLGIGLANFKQVFPVYRIQTPGDAIFEYAHNDYLQLLVEAGWPGVVLVVSAFIIFVTIAVLKVARMRPFRDPLRFFAAAGAVSGLISIGFHSLFDFNLQIPSNCIYFVLLLAIVRACTQNDSHAAAIRSALVGEPGLQEKLAIMTIAKKGLISAAVLCAATWLLSYGFTAHRISTKEPLVSDAKFAKTWDKSPQLAYRLGLMKYLTGDHQRAASFFKSALSADPFLMDAWLRLAKIEALAGNTGKAKAMLSHVARQTENIRRWKWHETLLALDLGMDELFVKNVNFLLSQNHRQPDTFQLLDTQFGHDAQQIMKMLDSNHMAAYLEWLMRWERVDDILRVWPHIFASDKADDKFVGRLVHFLLAHKQVRAAMDARRALTGNGDNDVAMTNPGFEEPLAGFGFGWQSGRSDSREWEVQRVSSPVRSGNFALQITFFGKKNLVFNHLYQIVPVSPGRFHRLSYFCRYQDITTDQGPFVEVNGYDCSPLHQNGDPMQGTDGWRHAFMTFTPPNDCHAVVVRLRRNPSNRFDSLIKGTLWLDDFQLQTLPCANHDCENFPKSP
jgi:tetratricopeptide (TPR) repeat protein